MKAIYESDTLLFISERTAKELILTGPSEIIDNFQSEFFNIISNNVENHKVTIDSPFIKITDEIKSKIIDLIEKWKDKDIHIFQLKKFFDPIPDGNYFSIMPKNNMNNVLYVYLLGGIRRLNAGSSLDEVLNCATDIQNYTNLFSELLEKYSADCGKHYVGEPDKNKRVCRFCGKSRPEVTFKKIAHAIPEGLGNKKLIDNEECDDCNQTFGDGLDNELIDYLSFFRGIFRIKGKKGKVESHFDNGYIKDNEKENGIQIASQNITTGVDGKPKSVEVISKNALIPQNVYKALVRISLGTLSQFDREVYKETLKWINDKEFYYNKLPKLAFMCSPDMYTEQPDIINYTRKNEDNLPFFVSELHLKFMVIVYIVPVTDKDLTYSEDVNYERFWNIFKHYASSRGWLFMDFSSNNAEKVKYTMKFVEYESGVTE